MDFKNGVPLKCQIKITKPKATSISCHLAIFFLSIRNATLRFFLQFSPSLLPPHASLVSLLQIIYIPMRISPLHIHTIYKRFAVCSVGYLPENDFVFAIDEILSSALQQLLDKFLKYRRYSYPDIVLCYSTQKNQECPDKLRRAHNFKGPYTWVLLSVSLRSTLVYM